MTATQRFLEDMQNGGLTMYCYNSPLYIEVALLEPLAWQAVGKTRGWKNPHTVHIQAEWSRKWHQFIDHLANGKDVDEALQAIE